MLGKAQYIAIGTRIRDLRRQKGWTQESLAKQCGFSTSFQGHIERGVRLPSVDTIIKIASLLDVSIDHLINGPQKRRSNTGAIPLEKPIPNDSARAAENRAEG